MRPTLLTLSFLLFAFTTYFPLAFTQDVERVLDTNENPIFPGGKYYIYTNGSEGGGVRLDKTGNSKFPFTIVQDFSETVNGLRVKFTISGITRFPGIILTDVTTLDIEFDEKPECAESSKWMMVENLRDESSAWVSIGGKEENQGDFIDGLFKIQKHGKGYKLVFCPAITASIGECFDIGTRDDFSGRRLVWTKDNPFQVVFVDANQNGISVV